VRRRALITGITGQDGSYLAEFLLHKGYEVHGLVRRSSVPNLSRLSLSLDKITLHQGDLADGTSLVRVLALVQPDEVYNLGAQSHVRVSVDVPVYAGDVTGLGVCRLLESVHTLGIQCRVYQAGSSEMFGGLFGGVSSLNETTPFHPRSPYGCAKVYAHSVAVNYRESYGIPVSNGILFNHESPRRGENFVTRKIIRWLAGYLKLQRGEKLYLGNLDAKRDWGYAPEYVVAMWKMLQHEKADDFVVATGATFSVREFLDAAFGEVGLRWEQHVVIDPKLYRPAEVEVLLGDASKALKILQWSPRVSFQELVRRMLDAECSGAEKGLTEVWGAA
jgi:GDPmannose 4,6-dehydratase